MFQTTNQWYSYCDYGWLIMITNDYYHYISYPHKYISYVITTLYHMVEISLLIITITNVILYIYHIPKKCPNFCSLHPFIQLHPSLHEPWHVGELIHQGDATLQRDDAFVPLARGLTRWNRTVRNAVPSKAWGSGGN